MPDEPTLHEAVRLLEEIRDNQRAAIEKQDEQLTLAHEQIARGKQQVEESLRLQREAMVRQRALPMFAFPAIAVCMGPIAYLILSYL